MNHFLSLQSYQSLNYVNLKYRKSCKSAIFFTYPYCYSCVTVSPAWFIRIVFWISLFSPLSSSSSYCCPISPHSKIWKFHSPAQNASMYPSWLIEKYKSSCTKVLHALAPAYEHNLLSFTSTHVFHSRVQWTITSSWLYFMFLSFLTLHKITHDAWLE